MSDLIPESIKGWTAEDTTEVYDRETIFDYIDGAGEVYLLYSFQDVLVKKFTHPEYQDIIVELFNMGKSEDAFGIFSHSHEKNDSLVGQGSELRGSLLCFWKNKYYVCIYSEVEQHETSMAILSLAHKIESNIGADGPLPEILKLLPREGFRHDSIKYFHKYTSLNYHYYLSEKNLLNLDNNTEAVLAIYDPGRVTLLLAKYESSEKAKDAYKSFVENYMPQSGDSGPEQIRPSSWVNALFEGSYLVIVFDSPDSESSIKLANKVKDKILSLK